MVSCYLIAREALKIQQEGWGYIWGMAGEILTANRLQDMIDEYNRAPEKHADWYGSVTYGKQWIGKRVADCSGLVKEILRRFGIAVAHGSNSQFLKYCKNTGKLKKGERTDGAELLPGTLVFLYNASKDNRHHVGIYVGSGRVVEAKGGKDGVVISKVTAWHEWGELKRVEYKRQEGKEEEPAMQTVRKGDTGAAVTALQESLVKLGYGISVDGIFGGETQKAVKAFQKKNGLDADGVCGPLTWAAISAAGAVAGGVTSTVLPDTSSVTAEAVPPSPSGKATEAAAGGIAEAGRDTSSGSPDGVPLSHDACGARDACVCGARAIQPSGKATDATAGNTDGVGADPNGRESGEATEAAAGDKEDTVIIKLSREAAMALAASIKNALEGLTDE